MLEPGIEYATAEPPGPRPLPLSIDGHIHLVRIDPRLRRLEAVMSGGDDAKLRTAEKWCRERHLAVAINMGMYEQDRQTNTGYARKGGYVNNGHWGAKYKAALGFAPTKAGVAPVLMADLDVPADKARSWRTTAPSSRTSASSGPATTCGRSRIAAGAKPPSASTSRGASSSSSAATPYTMKELNDILLALPLDLDAAMHVEGGPEASLSIHAGGVNLDLNGSYETGFVENDGERRQWAIPNVLGVRAR